MIDSPFNPHESSPVAAELSVYSGGQRRLVVPLVSAVEVGRQRRTESVPFYYNDQNSIPRLVVADRYETQISRSHVTVSPLPGGEILLQNTSRNCRITVEPGRELLPGKTCFVRGVARLHMQHVTIVVEPSEVTERMISLGTPRPLSQSSSQVFDRGSGDQGTSLVATLGSSFDAEQGDQLMMWLRTIAKLFYSASTNPRFLEDALHAIDDVIGLEIAMIWSRVDSDWQLTCSLSHGDIQTSPADFAAEFDENIRAELANDFAHVLDRIGRWRQTVLYHSAPIAVDPPSKSPHHAIVASPIINPRTRVVGALMGLRRGGQPRRDRSELITRLEASLVELIASGIRFDWIAPAEESVPPKTD